MLHFGGAWALDAVSRRAREDERRLGGLIRHRSMQSPGEPVMPDVP